MSNFFAMEDERFKRIVAVVSALVAVLATLIALAQSDAGARDDRANRDTKRYAIEAFGQRVSGDARVNFDYNSAYQAWYELDLLATSADNRDDTAAAERYRTLRDRIPAFSPLLQPPYFDKTKGSEAEANIDRYEAELYLVQVTTLRENFTAASAVKDAWDSKAGTYVLQLTILAVALFLFALCSTLSGRIGRWIFVGVGSVTTVYVAVWALIVWSAPVPDLRDSGAIPHYAQGVGFAHQSRWDEARAEYDAALQLAPEYANALSERANVYMAQENYAAAAEDLARAQAAGAPGVAALSDLSWSYYALGRFEDAITQGRAAQSIAPGDLWVRFNLGLALLASGQEAAARVEYQAGMDSAAKQVADALAAKQQPPYALWEALDEAASDLEYFNYVVETGDGIPVREKIVNPEAAGKAALDLSAELKSLAVGLEYTGAPPNGKLEATIAPFEFGIPVWDDAGELDDYEADDTFPYGTDELVVVYDYTGMRDGQEYVFKVYVNGAEDPSWRLVGNWEFGAEGTGYRPLSLAYSDVFVFAPGEYQVELYVDGHLAQRGVFEIAEEAP